MCGYVEINGLRPDIFSANAESEIARQFVQTAFKKYYPAFGKDPNRTIDVVIEEDGQYKSVEAIWWFDCNDGPADLVFGSKKSFNARNLHLNLWKNAIKTMRGVVFATGLGESKLLGKTKHQYCMQSDKVFALAALYQKLDSGRYSCAIITRDAHQKMAPYHDKAFPCFMPMDDDFLSLWLDKSITSHPRIDFMLENPVLYPTLTVQRR